jgi:hypothetical protein
LQEGVTVNTNSITGTLKYITGWTAFSGDVEEQSGNYIALHTESEDGATITVQVIGGDHPAATLDDDGISICRIKNTSQKIQFVATKEGRGTAVKTLSLSGLTLEDS